ncbi:PilN domain-containing protein [Undibacterium curvum]|uniref:PilN domain-containing protein n=1 Tax=Undibacterium curvum TaxID=2762294 RepID=UPI003D0D66E6
MMKRLNINFSKSGLTGGILRLSWLQRGLLFGFLILLFYSIFVYIGLLDTTNSIQNDIVSVQTKISRYQQKETPMTENIPNEKIRVVNQIVKQLNFPWSGLLNKLEKLTPMDIALLSIEPDSKKEAVRIEAEAKNYNAMLSYLAALNADGEFNDVVLIRHVVNEQESNKPLRFQFEAKQKQIEK